MEPMNTSRRNFLRLVGLGVPASVALAACGGDPSQTGAGGGSGGGKGVASYWTLSGKPQEDIRKDTVARFNKANPKSDDRRHALRQRRLQAEGEDRDRRRQGPDADLGLGRRWPEELRRRRTR